MRNKTFNVLFVCHGNICRSPMAEFILKHLVQKAKVAAGGRDLAEGINADSGIEDARSAVESGVPDVYVESAAVSVEEIGNPIYPPAKLCLSAHGIPFDKTKTARQVVRRDYNRFDLIVCMDEWNMRLIKRIIPEDPEGKIRLMMSFTGQSRDVADPWYTGDFEKTYQDLSASCTALLKEICASSCF